MNKKCSIEIEENTEKVSKDVNNKVTLINTSWKLKCENEKKDQEAELNDQCLVEARAWADELAKKHKSREAVLQGRIEQLIKDVQREEGKLLSTMQALNKSQKDDGEMQKQLEQMIVDFKREETKLKKSLKEMQDKNAEDDKALKEEVEKLEKKIQAEQLRSQEAINAAKGEHQVEITTFKA